ncbi:hypothetical protein CF386_12260 [Paraphotobacterium marinum]|uniref:Uncharacterized protein n=1 Tax=Paraphotobacterium marinum TaxID=1755811 RepID=A0A220VHT0_9GAMM|nr:efflux RND transporter periplasmic adaptor subunit [Paraphotobacterium marinum]ASK79806.1 hypothetical protein CF386_12260 [Paraphotobacterium marinum]
MFKTSFKKKYIILFVLLLSVFFIYQYFIKSSAPKAPKFPAQPVTVMSASQKVFPLSIDAQGIVISGQNLMLTSKTSGTIKKIYVKPGQYVKKGDLLVQIDDSKEIEALQNREQAFQTANKNYNRYEKLVKSGVVSLSDVEDKLDKYKDTISLLAEAKKDLQDTKIIAPFSGQIGLIANTKTTNNNNDTILTEGSYVEVNSEIVSLSNNQEQFIEYSIPQKYRQDLFIGQKVSFEDSNGHKINSKVSYISPNISPDTNAYKLRAPIPQQDNAKFVTGMYVDAEQLLNPNYKSFYIPALSLVTALTGNYVYVVENNKVVQKPITIESQIGDTILIKSGIKKGDLIVTSSIDSVSNGANVQVIPKNAKGGK